MILIVTTLWLRQVSDGSVNDRSCHLLFKHTQNLLSERPAFAKLRAAGNADIL